MLLIFTQHITPRVTYIFNYVLKDICGFDFAITDNSESYLQHSGATLNYSELKLKSTDIQITPNGFLNNITVDSCEAAFKITNGDVQLFLKANNTKPTIFDPFAAAFYLVSRYEEYLPFTLDAFNRFEAHSSQLFQNGLLHRPVVNEWAEDIKKKILNAYPALPYHQHKFNAIISIDVDQAFAFRHRGVLKNSLSFFKNAVRLKTFFLKAQLTALLANKDPFDTFQYLKKAQQTFSKPFVYFFNVGSYSTYDKNLPLTNQHFLKLLQSISSYAPVGLHPSYYANEQPARFLTEKEVLEKAIDKQVTKSRQHYLKLLLPHTYTQLLQAGITEDYSMGYATQPGFRAGTCTPFYWFNVAGNKATTLKVYPITYMEGTFAEDLKMTPQEATEKMIALTQTVKRYNGVHLSIWHNHTVNNQFFWQGWQGVFETLLQYIKNEEVEA